jgi:RHS repeat-associated protein
MNHPGQTPELNLMSESETSTSSTPVMAYDYIWFAGKPVAQVDLATNTTHWTFTDHLGTPILQTDATGTIDWRAEYEPFGSMYTLRTGATRHQPLRFPGQEADSLNGEREYNIFRWYRAGWGRYTQGDRIGLPGGLNSYSYVDEDPVNFIDSLGETKHCIGASRINYIGVGALKHHGTTGAPPLSSRSLFNLIIYDARCNDCHESIDLDSAYLRVPPSYKTAVIPLIPLPEPIIQFKELLAGGDAAEFDVSVRTSWVLTSARSTFDALARSMLLCYDCNK